MFFKEKKGFYASKLNENMQHALSGDFRYYPLIFCVFSESHKQSRIDAARFLNAALKNLTFDEVIKIDSSMRQTTSMEWSIDWSGLEPNNFLLPAMSIDEKKAVLVFASFNPNGYLREKAVKLLADYKMSLPYILLRRNDWVYQVRESAKKAFDFRMDHLSEGELLTALPYAEKLNRSTRVSHIADNERFYQALLKPENEKELLLGLFSNNQHTRILCVTALLSAVQPDVKRILLYLEKETVPHIRFVIYRKLLVCEGVPINDILGQMITEKYSRIRNFALQFIGDKYPEKAYGTAVHFLLDDNAVVRHTARCIVLKYEPDYDFRGLYIKVLETKTYAAICALGETGKKDDDEIIFPFLDHDTPRIVRAAMRSLMVLNTERYGMQITNMLDDARIGISKEAFTGLSVHGFYAYIDTIYTMYRETENSYTRIKCAILLFRCPKWESIIYMLEALSNDNPDIKDLAMDKITAWVVGFNRSFGVPSNRQIQRIKELIAIHEDKLGIKETKLLLFLVR